jgi:hypothetical protein
VGTFQQLYPITLACGAVMAASHDKDVKTAMNREALAAFSPCGNLTGKPLVRMRLKGSAMAWTTPILVEFCIGLEINGYLPAEL